MKKIFVFIIASIVIIGAKAQEMDLFLPPLNAKVIQFVNMNIGKQVGSGECWDLADKALEFANAKHDAAYNFGRKLQSHEMPLSGDIIQLENVKITMKLDFEGGEMIMDIPHHTAVIYQVIGRKQFKIADQNNGISGMKVAVNEMDLNKMERGTYTIFRPEKKD